MPQQPEPTVTFPSETPSPSAAEAPQFPAQQPPVPPARRHSAAAAAAAAAAAGGPQQGLQLANLGPDAQMGLDNFKFCTVLGRGHFGKVGLYSTSSY